MTSLVVCSSLAAGLGLALNSYALGVLLWGHRLQTPNHLLLLHLACVDIAFCLLLLVGNASAPSSSSSLQEEESKGDEVCRAQGFAWAWLPVMMLWSVCALSCDRYAAIASPLHYSRLVSRGKAGAFLLCSWLVGATLAAPPLVQAGNPSEEDRWSPCPFRFSRATLSCRPDCTGAMASDRIFAVLYVGLGALLPLCVVLACSWRVLSIARSHRSRIVAALYRVALSATSVAAPRPFGGRSALWTTGQLVGSLVALSAPFFGGVLWEAATGGAAHYLYLSVSAALLACAPPANAYVYGVRSRVLRRTLKQLVQRHLCKRQTFRDLEAGSRRASLARRFSAPVIPAEPVLTRTRIFSRSLRTPRQMERDSMLCRRASLLCSPDVSVHRIAVGESILSEASNEVADDKTTQRSAPGFTKRVSDLCAVEEASSISNRSK